MLKQITTVTALALAVMLSSATAQQPDAAAVSWPLDQLAKVSQTEQPIISGTLGAAGLPDSNTLSALVAWVSVISGLPPIYDHPRVEHASAEKMAASRYRALLPETYAKAGPISQAMSRYDILAFYDDAAKTIYLADGWTGTTPAGQSVLVHEMVHHLQNVADIKYECAQAREKLAYAAQQKWLASRGLDFFREFETDPISLMMRTVCVF